MVVLSASLCNKNGKALISRQYVEMTRHRVEGLLAAFPKLLQGNTAEKQHTFFETEHVRYIYLPLENLYLLLITNKGSKIVEDLETLRLLSQVVPDVIGNPTESAAAEHAFDVIFALDEVITAGGYREDVNLAQVRTNLAMESHEEKLALMIKQNKEDEARREATRKAQSIRQANRERERMERMGIPSGSTGSMAGFGSSNVSAGNDTGVDEAYKTAAANAARFTSTPAPAPAPSKPLGTGLKLGAKKKGASGLAALMGEEGISAYSDRSGTAENAVEAATAAAAAAVAEQVQAVIEEKINVSVGRDGGLENIEVRGQLSVLCNEAESAKMELTVHKGQVQGFQFQSNPKIDKNRFLQDSVIAWRNQEQGFPVNNSFTVLRWRLGAKDESMVPLSITCWPEEMGDGTVNVNVEYTLNPLPTPLTLNDVVIRIPLGTSDVPTVTSADGLTRHDARGETLEWNIDMISPEHSTGMLEFTVKGNSPDVFYPVTVQFTSEQTLCDLSVVKATHTNDGRQLRLSAPKTLMADNYVIV